MYPFICICVMCILDTLASMLLCNVVVIVFLFSFCYIVGIFLVILIIELLIFFGKQFKLVFAAANGITRTNVNILIRDVLMLFSCIVCILCFAYTVGTLYCAVFLKSVGLFGYYLLLNSFVCICWTSMSLHISFVAYFSIYSFFLLLITIFTFFLFMLIIILFVIHGVVPYYRLDQLLLFKWVTLLVLGLFCLLLLIVFYIIL